MSIAMGKLYALYHPDGLDTAARRLPVRMDARGRPRMSIYQGSLPCYMDAQKTAWLRECRSERAA